MQQSGDAPTPLPGGYKVGEKVFYTGTSHTFPSGDKLVHGQRGEVTGSGRGEWTCNGVEVLFPGNKASINCYLTMVRRLRAASAAAPRLRPTHATLPTRPLRYVPRRPLPLCRGAPALTACAAGLN